METKDQVLEKWQVLINACKSYYIDSVPTGLTDSEYDELERRAAAEDSFFVRDWVFDNFMKGVRAKNSYIEKIKKTKVLGMTMFEAIKEFQAKVGKKVYCDLKYDGSSIAIYLDPKTGKPKRTLTTGGLNLEDYGIDQTWKLFKFLPKQFPKGIVAIQCEALIDTNRLSDTDPQRARQRANGLINSKYCDAEVSNFLTLRAYRYYTDDSINGIAIREMDYKEVLKSFPVICSPLDGHIVFSPADVWEIGELEKNPSFCETDITKTSTGTFLNDGWVLYDEHGICLGALKYSGAGSGTEDVIKTTVRSIQWNDQSVKGKDSWSANVIIDPVTIKGCSIKKPSAGSVSKLVKQNITPGSQVSIILANSTIPMVGEVFCEGNGNFMWPRCSCGYQMSEKDVYSSFLKCGNTDCSERKNRMMNYILSLSDINLLDLNKLLVIDRFKWEQTNVNIQEILKFVENNNPVLYHDYLNSFLKTELQRKTLELVWKTSYQVLREVYERSQKA